MKCSRCAGEVPGQAQFCMRCGTPVNVGRPGGSAIASPPISYSGQPASKSKLPAILAVLAVIGIVAALVFLKLRPGKVADVKAATPNVGALTDTGARVKDTGPLTGTDTKVQPGPADPTDIIDYLKHVKETERKRLQVAQTQLAQIMELSSTIPAANATAVMDPEGDWNKAYQDTYNKVQADMSRWSGDWQALSKSFLDYPKPVPTSCTQLRDMYLDALGKTASSMATVGNAFGSALGGNPTDALSALSKMRGQSTRTGGIDEACDKADAEVARICGQYNIDKDFQIKADGGAQNPFGIGR